MRLLRLLLVILALGAALPAVAGPADDLKALFEREWQRDLRESPTLATYLGDKRYNRVWPDLSPAAIAASHAADRQALADLGRIPRAELSAADQLSLDLFRRIYEDRVAVYAFKPYLYPVNHRDGPQFSHEMLEQMRFDGVGDYEDFIARMQAFGGYMDSILALMAQGVREHRVQPRVILERVPAQVAKQLVASPEQSPWFAPFRNLPDTMPAADRDRLRAAAAKAIGDSVIPAFRRYDQFLASAYLPATRQSVGLWDTPDGPGYYRQMARYHTTTDLTPDEIHEIGLAEVGRIRGEMDKVIARVGFKGSFAEFVQYLRTDPKFYYKDPKELFTAYAATAKKIDPLLATLFGKLPRTPYGVRPIPDTSAPDSTTAYYQPPSEDGRRPGYYYVNLYKPESRPKYEMPVLTVHEAVPGHHLQIALAQEMGDVPTFRRFAGYTAFVEGWALYSERLGEEVGLYDDPYDKFGQLTYDMWRAVRLVVDTGMHHKHWTREQAIRYFMDNAAKSELDIVNEIDRYIAWPGQALAYKVGQMRILALRAEAEKALGPAFDLREFHDTLLSLGAVPLDTLERHLRDWIAAKRSRIAPATASQP
ncbi:MAG: DUF885 domain-containing protein [Gammaproteobacteria bacterium]|nr:DUF885 domain-containing protein [Gammaproteobacteria bacterium]